MTSCCSMAQAVACQLTTEKIAQPLRARRGADDRAYGWAQIEILA